MTPSPLAAEILETSAQGFALQANAVLQKNHDRDLLSLNSINNSWIPQIVQRILELAASVRVGEPHLFVRKIEWLRRAYTARGLSEDTLRATLEALKATLTEDMPDGHAAIVEQTISAALQSFSKPLELSVGLDPAESNDALALQYIAACMEGNTEAGIQSILATIDHGMKPEEVVTEVLIPAQREIGDLWHSGDASISQERLVTNTTIDLLSLIGNRYSPRKHIDRVVLAASVSGNAHDLGIRIATLLFKLAGWRTVFLGANVPTSEIAGAADYFGVQLVVLNATTTLHLNALATAIIEIRKSAAPAKIIVGGMAFDAAPHLWKQLNADAFCADIAEVVSIGTQLSA